MSDQLTERSWPCFTPSSGLVMEAHRQEVGSGHLLHTNLLLLGLEPARAKKEYGVEIGDSMFRSTNNSCLDVVLHFLYCRLQKPETAKKVFHAPFLLP